MHGSYRRAFGPENVAELQKNFILQHEDYLKQDDADKKQDALRYMAGYVVQYLHLVAHEKRFTFRETERVLHNSAMNIAEFDPREGALSFANLAKYAENLLEQPWRKDFHVIKLTSGFYVHNIAAQLQNAHEILIVMGYVNIDDTTLKLIPSHMNNSANLKAVSRDCYVASQECLILSQIWQHVADQEPEYPLTIGEVFEYRKNHLGDTDTICNKLLYDIRQRMHTLKLQQQLRHPPVPQLKNPHRFVPVDRLIDLDVDEGDGGGDPPTQPSNFIPEREREVERVQEHLKNTNMLGYNNNLEDPDHIYDPVYGGEIPQIPLHNYQRKLSYPQPPQSQPQPQIHKLYNNNSSRKSVPGTAMPYQQQQQQPYHHNNFNNNSGGYGSDHRNSSVSPLIPKTVTSMFSTAPTTSQYRSNVSKSNSMNSLNNGAGGRASSSSSSGFVAPLTRTKLKETDLDNLEMPLSPRAEQQQMPSYFMNDTRNARIRKSMPVTTSNSAAAVNQMYPDQFYPPGIVKPVAVYGSTQQIPPYYPRPRDNGEDVLNEAYAYASEVGQLPKGGQAPYQHHATPIPPASDSERGGGGNGLRSGSSTDGSSPWEGQRHPGNNRTTLVRKSETPKRPQHIDLQQQNQFRYADSSPESEGQGGQPQQPQRSYRELSSSSSGGASPASAGGRNYPRNEQLNSLDTVYFDYLLKQGKTDEVMESGRSNLNNSSSEERSHHHHRRSTQQGPQSSASSHAAAYQQEPEETHIYDGRRVVPKRLNDTVIRNKSQQPSSKSDNYNLLANSQDYGREKAGHHEKNVRKSTNHRVTVAVAQQEENHEEEQSVQTPSPPPKPLEPWDCRFCTFRNMTSERICEICAKSKDFYEEEASPVAPQPQPPPPVASPPQEVTPKLYSVSNTNVASVRNGGGASTSSAAVGAGDGDPEEEKECPQCTLLNPVRYRTCDACGFRLKPNESPKKNLEDLYGIR